MQSEPAYFSLSRANGGFMTGLSFVDTYDRFLREDGKVLALRGTYKKLF